CSRLRNAFPGCGLFAIEAKGEALGAAAGFDEFGEGRFVGRVAVGDEVLVKLRAAAVGDDVLADDDGVAGKRLGFVPRYGNERRDALGKCAAAIVIESAGIPDRFARRKRTKAGVEVIEMRVDQLERDYFAVQKLADELLAADIAANAVAGD